MADFEELRLTVNLEDNASLGLTKIRTEIGLLTGAAQTLTAAAGRASASVGNLGSVSAKATPGLRSMTSVVQEASRNANALKDGFTRLGVAAQGLSAIPAIAQTVRDMGMALNGLSGAFEKAGMNSAVAIKGIGGVAIAVAALGASIVAYGVSVFRFARDMEQLGKTAKQMGMSFAELKFAQDEAKRFGLSAESIIRSFQGVQDAQFDLWKNNSQLRQRLIGMGVDANWVNQLAAMDPNKARNAIIGYGKALERQLIEAGVSKGIARSLRNQFGAEFGFAAEDMERELPEPDAKKRAELDRIDRLSKEIKLVWGDIGHEWDTFAAEVLSMGLPILLDGMKSLQAELPALLDGLKVELNKLIVKLPDLIDQIPQTLTTIRTELGALAEILKGVAHLYTKIVGTGEATAAEGEAGKDAGRSAAPPAAAPERKSLSGDAGINDIGKHSGGGDPTATTQSFAAEELVDETGKNTSQVEKLTTQVEKLNTFYEEKFGKWGGGGGGGGAPTSGGGGSPVSGGGYDNPQYGGTSGGPTASGGPIDTGGAPSGGPTPGQDPSKIPFHLGGTLEMDGKTYHYGSGGRGRGATPPGSYDVNVATQYGGSGQLGDIGRRIGSIATVGGLGGTYNDPRYPGSPRAGVQIHSASSSRLDQLYSQGCFAVSAAEWPAFKAHLLDLNRRTPGGLRIDVGRDGRAQIVARGAKIPLPDRGNVPALAKNSSANDNYPTLDSHPKPANKLTDLYDDRGALSKEQSTIRADGSVKVDVEEKRYGSRAGGSRKLFADTPAQRQEAGQLTHSGPNASKTADEYGLGIYQ